MRRLTALLALVPLLAATCGGSGTTHVLSQTAKNLGKIRSGVLSLRLLVTPRAAGPSQPFGFELHGPFALAKAGSLPRLHVDYTQIANGQRATVTVVSNGSTAYVSGNGRTISLPASALESLRSVGSGSGTGKGLGFLGVDKWLKNSRSVPCRGSLGANVECVRSDLDVVRATNDLLSLARGVTGRVLPQITGDSAKQLRDSVDSATVFVATGKKDRLLRSLAIDVRFGVRVPKALRAAVGSIVGARVRFELGVRRRNRPVSISG
jgi:hypothetical protein